MRDISVADIEERARGRLPKFVFDFVAGGAEDELTLRANRADFENISLRPRMLVDVSDVDCSTTVFGDRIALPLLLAPTGVARMLAREGELAAAKAAGREGTIFVLSAASSYRLEEVKEVATGPLWFQLYAFGGRGGMASLTKRAEASGFRVLCFTVDAPVVGKRERDLRNDMTLPPHITMQQVLSVLRRPLWLKDYLMGRSMMLSNMQDGNPKKPLVSLLPRVDKALVNPSITWADVAWLRKQWQGPLVIKGIMTEEDALLAIEHGIDGVVVSNHGGRQLDGASSTVAVLPEIVDAVNGRAEVFVDGGIRRGADVIKALAIGARACLIGRPYCYGLAAGGEEGVVKVLQILRGEILRTLMLVGRCSIADLDRSVVRIRESISAGSSKAAAGSVNESAMR